MRVMLIGPKLPSGGLGRFVNDILEANLPFELSLYDVARPLKKNIRPYKVNANHLIINAGLRRLFQTAYISLLHIVKFPAQFKKINPDIIHMTTGGGIMFLDTFPYIVLTWKSKAKIVLHWLAPLEPCYKTGDWLSRIVLKIALTRVDGSIVLSHEDEKLLSNLVPDKNLLYATSSIDTAKFAFASPSQLIPDANHFVNLLFIGGIDPFRKGIQTLIDAFPLILKGTDQPVRLVVTGSESTQNYFNHIEENIRDHILFFKWIEEYEKPSFYKACDILVLPSIDEGLPYALVEAIGAGLPVVSTPVGGIPDVIVDGENGFLVPIGQPETLAQKILELINNPDLRQKISKNNSAKAVQYSLKNMFMRITNFYYEFNQSR